MHDLHIHQTSSMAHVPGSGLPASPTLSNPDLILPDEFEAAYPTQTSRQSWQQGSDLDIFTWGPSLAQIGPLTPTTPIIYGNGTMLSDIGEVTEAESPPVRRPRAEGIREAIRNRDLAPNSSPTMGYNTVLKRTKGGNHERKISVESTDTITSNGQTAKMFEDLDDSVSVDDSNFQGDDEESVFEDGSEYAANEDEKPRVLVRKESKIGQDEDGTSSAALSRRAELILANAKKRLDTMEGNLSKARSSLYITPSPSLSSINSSSPFARSTPSPQLVVTKLGAPPRHHGLQSPSSLPDTPGHSRVSSENSLTPSTQRYFIRSVSAAPAPPSKAATRYPVRSASAAAVYRETSSTAKGLASKQADNAQVNINRTSSPLNSPPYSAALEPLSEDDTGTNLNSPIGSIAEAHFSSVEHRLTRSTSSNQMRDLRDQMKDLKGKISSLRDRAREENMRRRSMQSLRTPSPFTAAEQWYAQGTPYIEKIRSGPELMPGAWNDAANPPFAVQAAKIDEPVGRTSLDTAPSIYEDVQENPTREHSKVSTLAVQNVSRQIEVTSREENYDTATEKPQETEDMDTEYGSDYGDEVVDYEELDGYPSESEASFYHESRETPVSHEDREDAFDYQHYFLSSAMRNLGREGGRRNSIESYDSEGSEGSVETARGIERPSSPPEDESMGRPVSSHERKDSGDSISTLATFATASEGLEEEEYEDEEDDTPIFNDYSSQNLREPSRSSTPSTAREDIFPDDVTVSPRGTTVSAAAGSFRRETNASSAPTIPAPTSPLRSFPLKSEDHITSPNSIISPNESVSTNTLKHTYHKPSISSFTSSSGTVRSFPLFKPKTPTPNQTPSPRFEAPGNFKENSFSINSPRDNGSDNILSPNSSITKVDDRYEGEWKAREDSPVNMLVREDQVLVERVVASLGKCVLGMQEVSRGSTEGRMWRRRLDNARRVLEGSIEL